MGRAFEGSARMVSVMITNAEGVRWGDVCEAWEDQGRDDRLYAEIVRVARMARARKVQE